MHKWYYEGPVMEFDRLIASVWRGETSAPTEAKAKTNLAYQFKQKFNRSARAKITLPGKIIMMN